MPTTEITEGPPCVRGCGVPKYITTITTQDPPPLHEPYNLANNTRHTDHHDCPREPAKILGWLLDRIGSWTNARWDQHARNEFGDVATEETVELLAEHGVKTYRGHRIGTEIEPIAPILAARPMPPTCAHGEATCLHGDEWSACEHAVCEQNECNPKNVKPELASELESVLECAGEDLREVGNWIVNNKAALLTRLRC